MRVLLLDLDTLRPDHLGCYGYHRETSPNIDSVASEGVRFTNYYTPNAPCLPSRSALFSGRFGFHTGVVGHGGTAADPVIEGPGRDFMSTYAKTCLPSIFQKEGHRTALISPFGERHSAFWVTAGFNEVYNTGGCGNEIAEEISPVALDWIDKHGAEENWYLHINFWDAHTSYRTPEAYGNPFAEVPDESWITGEILERHKKMPGPHGALEPGMYGPLPEDYCERQPATIETVGDVKRMNDGYDTGIRYMDEHVGKIFDALREKGVWDDLCVIITSDHGENMGELGIYAEHGTADEATCRIPMIFRWPGGQKGAVDEGLHYNLDLLPTLTDLLQRRPAANWDGTSYAAAITAGEGCGRDALVLGQCAHVCQRSARFDDHLYIRTYHDGYHLFPKHMLFNVREDPHEQHDLAPEKPRLVEYGASLMLDWIDSMMETQGNRPDPMWTVLHEGGPYHAKGQLAQYASYLEKTGRGNCVPELKKRHPQEYAGKEEDME